MATKDISRFLHQPKKRYSGVRMQQGRVILDSDWNESERLDDEEARKVRLDVLGPKGTADDGFEIGAPVDEPNYAEVIESPPAQATHYKVPWTEGSYYVGGVRFEAHETNEDLLAQQDFDRIDNIVGALPDKPTAARNDLVYLEGWEQCVTATEDAELKEAALGGPDTSVRVRRMRRVHVKTGVASTSCPTAFGELTAELEGQQSQNATFDAASCELESNSRLTVGFASEPFMDPCAPAAVAGYAGADNDAIRVQLVSDTQLIWGRDNASSMFKASVSSDGTTLTLQTLPRDQASQPLARQAIEILAPGAVLSNGERIAELTGEVHEIQQSYDPDDQTVTLATPVSADLLAWLNAQGGPGFVYARLWTGGPAATFTPGVPMTLPGTNLTAQIDTPGLEGDFWVIAARPNAPEELVPWSLETIGGEPPMGPRRFYAPLAIVEWTDGVGTNTVHDCRSIIDPLAGDKRTAKIIVGNAPAGDTLEVCDFLDPGDGSGIASAVAAATNLGGDVLIRAGSYDLSTNGSLSTPISIPAGVSVRGAGTGAHGTTILGRASGDQGIFEVLSEGALRELRLFVPVPTIAGTGSTFVVRLDTGAVAADLVVEFAPLQLAEAGLLHLREAFRFGTGVGSGALGAQCIRCRLVGAPRLTDHLAGEFFTGFADDRPVGLLQPGPRVVQCVVDGTDHAVAFVGSFGNVVSDLVADQVGSMGIFLQDSSSVLVDGAYLVLKQGTGIVPGAVVVAATNADANQVAVRGVVARVFGQMIGTGVRLVGVVDNPTASPPIVGRTVNQAVVSGCAMAGFDESYVLEATTDRCAVVGNTGDATAAFVDNAAPGTNTTAGTI